VDRRDGVESDRERLMDYVSELQASVRTTEGAIFEHSKASAISADGRVNIAYSMKKKRLNDEHDALLGEVEAQRLALSQLDTALQNLNDEREAKEDEMKALERRLVELLVSQQKKLLGILQEAATTPKEVDERDPGPATDHGGEDAPRGRRS